uniref:TIR domain-containing protein n=1 Tax=Angiostrongylus cantonensis TaxID=6313 RepID=A0A0K0DK79_ANGCA
MASLRSTNVAMAYDAANLLQFLLQVVVIDIRWTIDVEFQRRFQNKRYNYPILWIPISTRTASKRWIDERAVSQPFSSSTASLLLIQGVHLRSLETTVSACYQNVNLRFNDFFFSAHLFDDVLPDNVLQTSDKDELPPLGSHHSVVAESGAAVSAESSAHSAFAPLGICPDANSFSVSSKSGRRTGRSLNDILNDIDISGEESKPEMICLHYNIGSVECQELIEKLMTVPRKKFTYGSVYTSSANSWTILWGPERLQELTTLAIQSTVCAALNSRYPLQWVFGVGADRKVVGCLLSDDERDTIRQAFDFSIGSGFLPPLPPDIVELNFHAVGSDSNEDNDRFLVEIVIKDKVCALYQLSPCRIFYVCRNEIKEIQEMNKALSILSCRENSGKEVLGQDASSCLRCQYTFLVQSTHQFIDSQVIQYLS